MKQNSCSVVGEVSKPTGIGLDELDGTIEALRAGVADSVVAVAQQTFLMAPELLNLWLEGVIGLGAYTAQIRVALLGSMATVA